MRRLVIACLCLSLTACASSAGSAREKLALSSRDVLDAMQFKDFNVVANYLRSDLKADFLARAYGAEKSLSLVEFQTLGIELAPDQESARAVVRISWYELPSTRVETETVFFDWKRADSGRAAWFVDQISGGPLPVPDPSALPSTGEEKVSPADDAQHEASSGTEAQVP